MGEGEGLPRKTDVQGGTGGKPCCMGMNSFSPASRQGSRSKTGALANAQSIHSPAQPAVLHFFCGPGTALGAVSPVQQ